MLELYGTRTCPYTRELREELWFRGQEFREYDVEADPDAFRRLVALTGGRAVPVLAEDGRVVQVGYQGRTCLATPPAPPAGGTGDGLPG
ncbi:glutaredoxin family protein [Thermaerobacter sp. PB12/4term]|uniref:glutaredoxin family protein n=1 Tax=Thermaerobacter sp. PB12/4term TaxID=2293838 RepID=UPI000E3262C0|nr:glutaredoxin family protein [Thermaerobacter sp. PB12/4term]QIA27577.1 glutaredoxin family protein [Thermaerobacter sp. PB12/4term]